MGNEIAECQDNKTSDMPYVGISIRSLNVEEGMEIVLVNSDAPAWHAGLKVSDVLLQINGEKVNNIEQYKKFLTAAVQKGEMTVNFKVARRGKIKVV